MRNGLKIDDYCKCIECLELCTGSGAVAVSIAKISNVNVTATDISEPALKVAKRNAEKLNTDIQFIRSDLFENITEKYNLIVANPPYIETSNIELLDENVKKEPRIALDGGKDGLDFYRKIANNAYKYLEDNGFVCLEIGYNQKDSVMDLLKDKYSNIKCIKDLAGNDRVIVFSKKK